MGRTRLKFYIHFYLSEGMYQFSKKVLEKEVKFVTINKDYTKMNKKYKSTYFKNLDRKVVDLDDKTLLPHAKIDMRKKYDLVK